MATLDDLWQGIRTALIAATGLPAKLVFIDIPAQGTAANVAKGDYDATGGTVVSIFDQKMSSDSTRWPILHGADPVNVATKATCVASAPYIPAGGSIFVEIGQLSGGLILNDAVGFTVFNGNQANGATALVDVVGENPSTLALDLATKVNANPILSTWLSATARGSVVELTSIVGNGMNIIAAASNQGTQALITQNEWRCLQISIWSRLEANRNLYGEMVRQWVATTQQGFGIQLNDGSWARIKANGSEPTKDTHQADVYRWIFLIEAEISVISQDTQYPVLAIQEQETIS